MDTIRAALEDEDPNHRFFASTLLWTLVIQNDPSHSGYRAAIDCLIKHLCDQDQRVRECVIYALSEHCFGKKDVDIAQLIQERSVMTWLLDANQTFEPKEMRTYCELVGFFSVLHASTVQAFLWTVEPRRRRSIIGLCVGWRRAIYISTKYRIRRIAN